MKRLTTILITLITTLAIYAQGKPQFDPEKFENQLEQAVIKDAGITSAESAKFLPLYREMRKKLRAAMDANRKTDKAKPTTEKEWAQVLKSHDNLDIQMKKIEQSYHNQFLKVLPASKVVKMIKAEEDFHRDAFRKIEGHKQPGRKPGHPKHPKHWCNVISYGSPMTELLITDFRFNPTAIPYRRNCNVPCPQYSDTRWR